MKAEVVDITAYSPISGESYIVDTNVLIWTSYPRIGIGRKQPRPYQLSYYPAFIEAALDVGSNLFRVETSFAEIAHVIERKEAEYYSEVNSVRDIGVKAFRKTEDPEAFSQYTRALRATWEQVSSLTAPVDCEIDADHIGKCLSLLESCRVDAYDASMVIRSKESEIINIISDDGDLATVPGIRLFTANPNVLAEATMDQMETA